MIDFQYLIGTCSNQTYFFVTENSPFQYFKFLREKNSSFKMGQNCMGLYQPILKLYQTSPNLKICTINMLLLNLYFWSGLVLQLYYYYQQ